MHFTCVRGGARWESWGASALEGPGEARWVGWTTDSGRVQSLVLTHDLDTTGYSADIYILSRLRYWNPLLSGTERYSLVYTALPHTHSVG